MNNMKRNNKQIETPPILGPWISIDDRLPETDGEDEATECVVWTGKAPGAMALCSVFWEGKFYVASTWGEYEAGEGGDEIKLASHWIEL